MIATRTVFVLGAGASMPYAFPSGAQLRRELVEEFGSRLITSAGGSLVKLSGFSGDQVRGFAHAFSRSNMASIDAFLAKRQEFADVGKAAIALILSRKEVDANLFSDRIDDH